MSGLFRRWKKAALDADSDLLVNNIKAVLFDLTDLIGVGCRAITGATNATPIVLTVTSHGYTNGDYVSISGVLGNTAANGTRKIKNQATNSFELTDIDDVNIAGNGAYTSGGFAINLTTLDFLDDLPSGGRVAISGNLASKTTTNGRFDFDDFTWSSVTGDQSEAVFFYDDTPATEATKFLIAVDDGATNLPVTPNGGNITYQVNASGLFDI